MKITVMSRLEAIEHSIKSEINKCIIISINSLDNDKTYLYKNDNILGIQYLYFNDIERDYEGCIAPKQKDFFGLKLFIDTFKDNEELEEIIVHCAAGISRSSAVAAAICKYLDIDELETIWNKSCYIPNTLVYKLAKQELGLEWDEEEFAYFHAMNVAERDKMEIPIDINTIYLNK